MIRLAVIGTNWISNKFIEAALKTREYQLTAVYSRSLEKAQEMATQYGVAHVFNDLESLKNSALIDAIYIASPNSCHAPQAIQMMQAGKHVICEKPLASNYVLAQQMFQVAEQEGVVLFEAFKTAYLPNFAIVKEQLAQIGTLRKAVINYCQYSSRYPKYLNGERPNTFLPELSNGSIMDIGYYCLASAVELFGEPDSVQAKAHLLETGVDGSGSVVLSYNGFDVILIHSKISDSYLPSEIQGEEAALHIDAISICRQVTKIHRQGDTQLLGLTQEENDMLYEAQAFAEQIKQNQMNEADKQRSLTVAKLLTTIRSQIGVIFPADVLENDE